MGTEPLADACELAFEVARQGVEASPPIDPPASMRSFLYVAQLPRRAMSVAQRVIDSDPQFRQRVAAQATEARVGRAGYLWLQRPDGWEASFSALTGRGAATIMATPTPAPTTFVAPPPVVAAERGVVHRDASAAISPAPMVPPPAPPTISTIDAGMAPPPPPAPPASSGPLSTAPDAGPTAVTGGGATHDSIQSELASLRSLVDRLAEERQNVGSSVEHLETEVGERRAESNALSHRMEAVQAELAQARQDREHAEREQRRMEEELHSVRAELDQARSRLNEESDRQADVSRTLATAEAELESLARTARQAEVDRVDMQQQLDALGGARDAAVEQMAIVRAERDDLADRVAVAEQARVDLEGELERVSTKWQDVQVELRVLAEQRGAVERELEELRAVEASSLTDRRRLFDDLAGQLGRIEAERDLLASQLEVAHDRIRGTRSALDSATRSIASELDGVDAAFVETNSASGRLDDAVQAATARLGELDGESAMGRSVAPGEQVVAEQSGPDGRSFEAISFEEASAIADPVLSDPVLSDAVLSDAVLSDAEVDTGGSAGSDEMDDVFAAYGFGADSGRADVDDQPSNAAFEPFDGHRLAGSAEDLGLTDLDVFDMPASDVTDRDTPEDDGSGDQEGEPNEPDTAEPEQEFLEPVAVGERSGLQRRQQIQPMAGDPVAVARHTVSSADVVLLVEGDAVASLGWPTLSTSERRGALVSYLADLAAESGAAPDVVFDGSVGGEGELPSSRAVRVRLTAVGVRATTALSELVDAYPLEWPVAVVTDDGELARDAGSRGAAVLDNGQLLDLFIAP